MESLMRFYRFVSVICMSAMVWGNSAAQAGVGDLLVAPTRVIIDGGRGTEVILNNIGTDTATYRISLELRRMSPEGEFTEVAPEKANEIEAKALSMISFAPRRVVLPPNQPQAIRVGVRAPQGLPDGEYRAHMLFRAIPVAKPVTAPTDPNGLSIALTPIYGITIPIIVRRGQLKAVAALSDAKLTTDDGRPALSMLVSRTGSRSTYGRIRVLKSGVAKPVYEIKGISVYTEVNQRRLTLLIEPEVLVQLKGQQVTIQYMEEYEAGGGVMAELKTVIR
jgi:P pilus assembly chaperone PapD